MSTVEPQGPESVDRPVFDVQVRTDLAVEAFLALRVGYRREKNVLTDTIGPQMEQLEAVLRTDGITEVEPFKPIDIRGPFALLELMTAFNKLNAKSQGSDEDENLYHITDEEYDRFEPKFWSQYSADDINDRLNPRIRKRARYHGQNARNDRGHVRAMLLDGDVAEEPGLTFVGQTYAAQTLSIQRAIRDHAVAHKASDLAQVNTADVLMINAQRIIEGRPLLDSAKVGLDDPDNTRTATRTALIGKTMPGAIDMMKEQIVGHVSVLDSAKSNLTIIALSSAWGGYESDRIGVRRSVGPNDSF